MMTFILLFEFVIYESCSMSSLRFALEKLDLAIGKLDSSVSSVEQAFENYVPAGELSADNVIDVDFVAGRLDSAIARVEALLSEEE